MNWVRTASIEIEIVICSHYKVLHDKSPLLFPPAWLLCDLDSTQLLYLTNCSPYAEDYQRDRLGVSGHARFFHVLESDYSLSACYIVSLWILFLLHYRIWQDSLLQFGWYITFSVCCVNNCFACWFKYFYHLHIIFLFLYCHDTVATFLIRLDLL